MIPDRVLDATTSAWCRWRARGGPGPVARSVVSVWSPDGEVRDVSPETGFFALPSIRPDGSEVVFHGGSDGPSRIWRTDLTTGKVTELSPDGVVACSPSFSPDGTKIVFSGYDATERPAHSMREAVRRYPGVGLYFGGLPAWMRLYVMDANGGDAERLTNGPASDVRAAFAPDGRGVYFLRRVAPPWGPRTLWRASAHAEAEPVAVVADRTVGRPAPSPDGAWIYCFTDLRGSNRLARVPVNGGPLEPLGRDTLGSWSHGPACDPEGAYVWYHSNVDGGSLCRLRVDAGGPEVMTPPGLVGRGCAHASVAADGAVAFDRVERASASASPPTPPTSPTR